MDRSRQSCRVCAATIRTTSSIARSAASPMRAAALDFDGFSELWFDDLPSMQAAFAAEKQVKELGEDEARFIGDLKLITAIQHVVIPKPTGVPLIKRMSTLKRRPDVSAEKFKEEWFDVHSVLVKRLPQVKAYTQNLIFDRSHGRGKPATYD